MSTYYYQISLTEEEMDTLSWATERGYFPRETFDALEQMESDEKEDETWWQIPEHAAWAILLQREDDPHSLYACLGGHLLKKLIDLENSIV